MVQVFIYNWEYLKLQIFKNRAMQAGKKMIWYALKILENRILKLSIGIEVLDYKNQI